MMRPLHRVPEERATADRPSGGARPHEQLARGGMLTRCEPRAARRGSRTIASEPGGFGVGECHG
jgi:hypothetical protein